MTFITLIVTFRYRYTWVGVTLVLGGLLLGCSANSTNQSALESSGETSVPPQLRSFPQQEAPPGDEQVGYAAAASGRLTLVDGCLRLVDAGDPSDEGYLIIWPASHYAQDENGTLAVYDGLGRQVAKVGDDIEMGGGEDNQTEPITETAFGLQEPTPPECPGPYWIMSRIVAPDKLTPRP